MNNTIPPKPPTIVAWGGGLNSTAMLVGLQARCIRPDLILFADTGGEKPETYAFITTLQAWLKSVAFPELIVVKKTSMYESLEDNCLKKKMLPSLAYGFKSCSEKWKKQPQDKYCNNWQPARDAWARGQRCLKIIGYDAGEERRAKIKEDAKYAYWYPLIEWGWYREDCEKEVIKAGMPVPPKSSCFFCPAMKKPEIIQLSISNPDLLKRAIAMEDNAELTSMKGLGRYFSWREFVEGGMKCGREPSIEIPCGCVDQDDE